MTELAGPSPIPDRDALQDWTKRLAAHLSAGDVSGEELVEMLAAARQASRDLGWISDWLLLAAREQGANLPALATAWSRDGKARYVHAPDTRLRKLSDHYTTAETLRRTFAALPRPQDSTS